MVNDVLELSHIKKSGVGNLLNRLQFFLYKQFLY